MDRPISKRAVELDQIGSLIKGTLWRRSEGFFENVLRLSSYAIPFVPGLNWGWFLFEALRDAFGYGLKDLGKFLDSASPISSTTTAEELPGMATHFIKKLTGGLQKAEATYSEEQMKKVAFFGGIMKLFGLIKPAVEFLLKAAKWFMLAAGATTVGNMYSASTSADGIAGMIGGALSGGSLLGGALLGGQDKENPLADITNLQSGQGLLTKILQQNTGTRDPEMNPDNYGPEGYRAPKV